MKLDGDVQLDTPIDNVWKVFMDPSLLCRATPGCEDVWRIDETHYEGVVAVKLQFLTVRARVHGTLVEAREPTHLVADVSGEAMKIGGSFRARMILDLAATGSVTQAHWALDIDMLGRLGNLGEPLVRTASRKMAARFAGTISSLFEPAP